MALKVDTIQNPSSTVINLTLDTSGNVTVGNNLTVTGTTTVAATTIGNLTYTGTLTGSTGVLNIGSGQLYKDASGNVGIGTTSPRSPLAFPGTVGTVGVATKIRLFDDGASNIYGFGISAGQLDIIAGTGGATTFYTNGSERMRIDSSGNVGIGTSSPGSKLAVTSGNNEGIVTTNGTQTTKLFNSTSITAGALWVTSNHALSLGTNNAEQMRIDSSGNVGIGTSSPACKFDVAGLMRSTSVVAYPSSGVGLEMYYTAGQGILLAYDRSGSVYKPLSLNGSQITFSIGGGEAARIDSSGNLQIGTTSNLGKITTVWNNSTQQGMVFYAATTTFNGSPVLFYNSSGVICGFIGQTASTITYNTTSDYRLKDNVQPLKNGLETVKALNPVNYNWKIDDANGEGFIAHELQKVIPLAVTGEKDAVNEDGSIKPQSVDYSKVVVHLVAAIQELSAKVAALEAKK